MQTQEDKLEQEIFRDAERRAERALERAKRDAGKLATKAERRVTRARKARMEQAESRAVERERAITSSIDHDVMRQWLVTRETVFEELFATALQASEAGEGIDTEASLRALVLEGMRQLGKEAVTVRVRTKDAGVLEGSVLEELQAEAGVPSVTVLADESLGGGVVLETDAGRRRFDNTYATRLRRMKAELRAKACEHIGLDLADIAPER
ncbi:MAG: hypothetical protein HN742_14905 [Lentisphaerae bacterium]|jgi:vacuolar-type H+-ATPase subunit E/Vma4|nr:hypothetical protein [Lentisphaerota bacterium]MBT4822006.1 hypothetical protein [Lentisphaerota bacterium]MBT5609552.1 hypothetical protein [Lentisphaerota bacterium]MBT7058458.1 hypothetical protein [Lentisphaerota bacterium]MBT7843167.1 hypothetical protein [Lentisphaerota bacterium]